MSGIKGMENEGLAAAAFDRQSLLFDELYGNDAIIQYKRNRVRKHVEESLQPGSRILELNAGTGEDAIYFAQKGYQVHATDISAGMQAQMQEKISKLQLKDFVSTELCSFTGLDELKKREPYDCIFSNFAGLNCTQQLESVLKSFSVLLRPGGLAVLVILPSFCLWESLLFFRGNFKTAFRRLSARKGARSHMEGVEFKCWYYNPSLVIKTLKPEFEVLKIEGLCTIVPPSYIKGFGEKYPRMFRFLTLQEDKLKAGWPWKFIGDYYIISLVKKA
jgi:ubiquinone/menaquinone biosynthesis C-methylase UbiE